MPKNNHSNDNKSNNQSKSNGNSSRNAALVILLIAILFFLLALGVLAKATGFNLLDSLGLMRKGDGVSQSGSPANTGTDNGSMTGTTGETGTTGGTGTTGSTGATGGTGTNGGGATGSTVKDLNVHAKTDTGVDVNAGIKQGQVFVSPQVKPNLQGGTGAQVNVNDQKVIDTNSVLP